ncbi:MAG: type I glyceraldehyde-3-phosphate dehydrogenase [Candidatus Cloacimonetes bacterium]|nr:type I glyceraldehyde-3-phosphate dehydrogenase [Candidatus Cloacimonadota bacterium]
MTRVAINGFGRIGRAAFKTIVGPDTWGRARRSPRITPTDYQIVAINDLTDTETLAYLLKYDTVYGIFPVDCGYDEKHLIVDKQKFPVFAEKDPANLPWDKLQVDVVLECTGVFEEYEKAKSHLTAGAKKVIISAPGKGKNGKTLVFGTETINHQPPTTYQYPVSNASCTTNCIAPVIQVLHSNFGLEKSLMTTVHAYTATQNLVDGPSKDLRRGRAAAENIVPSSTGAAIATTEVIPELANVFDGVALRVPLACGSISDITAVLKRNVTVSEVNRVFTEATKNPLFRDILEVSEEPLVSTDIIGSPASAIVDLEFTRVVGGNLVKVLAWYDNEWAYANRLVELAQVIGK